MSFEKRPAWSGIASGLVWDSIPTVRTKTANHKFRHSAQKPILAAVACTLLVLLALCLPGDTIEEDDGLPFSPPPGSDKLVHAGLFFTETRFLRRAFPASGSLSPLALAIGVALLLSVATEAAQLFIPGRDGNGYDLLADALGVGLYAGIFRWRSGQKSTAPPASNLRTENSAAELLRNEETAVRDEP